MSGGGQVWVGVCRSGQVWVGVGMSSSEQVWVGVCRCGWECAVAVGSGQVCVRVGRCWECAGVGGIVKV